jgi:hypothetical protein
MTVAFIACAERGTLEQQALLLCRSLRRYGGRYARAPFYTFQPRGGTEISDETLAALNAHGVEHVTERLNTEHKDCPYANKIFASAWAEEHLREEVLVFLDSDTVMTGEPSELDLPDGIDAAARPVNNRKLGSTGVGDLNEGYWKRLYEICGVEGEPFVNAAIDDQSIRAYFNSGLVAVRRRAGLFRQWREDFLRLMRERHFHAAAGVAGMDEFSLAATLGRAFGRVKILDARYNYPLQFVERPMLGSTLREAQLEELVHVHYRFGFNVPGYLRLLRPPLDHSSEIVRWLERHLPLRPIVDDSWLLPERRPKGKSIHEIGARDCARQ